MTDVKEIEEFRKGVCDDLQYKLNDKVMLGVTMMPIKLLKEEAVHDGLLVSGGSGQKTVDLTKIMEVKDNHDLYFDEVERIGDEVADALRPVGKITLGEVGDYDNIRDHLKLCAMNTERNAEYLQTVPHFEMEDISIIYRVDLGNVEGNHPMATITNQTLKAMGITEEQLHKDAMEQVPKQDPAFLMGMNTYLGGQNIMDPELLQGGEEEQLFMLMPQSGFNGAGIIAYPEVMDRIAEQMKGDFFVLPSSIHEILITPDQGNLGLEQLKATVKEINESQVMPEDQLSNHVYHYDSRERLFEIDDRFEARMEAQKEGTKSLLESLDDKKQEIAGKAAGRAADTKVKKMEETR